MLAGDFGHFLIHRDGITVGGPNFSSGQKDVNAVVMMAKAARVMKATDRSDGITVFFKWLEGTGKFVVPSRFGDLVIEGMDTVGQIDKSAPSGCGNLFGCLERSHAFEHGEGNAGTHSPKSMASVDKPGL